MATSTREKLIEVARQLFDRKGLENTTMSDIANASDKGRRTIYTYFKNKREIYGAVIERESENLVLNVRTAVDEAGDSPVARLQAFVRARIQLIFRESAQYRDSSVYRVLFVRRWERVRCLVLKKELELLRAILDDGIRCGDFDAQASERVGGILQLLFQGIEIKCVHEYNLVGTSELERIGDDVSKFVLAALRP